MLRIIFKIRTKDSGNPIVRFYGSTGKCEGGCRKPRFDFGENTKVDLRPVKVWPDAICDTQYMPLVVSKRMLETTREAEIKIEARSLICKPVEGDFHQPPPDYSYLIREPGMEINQIASKYIIVRRCEVCGQAIETERLPGFKAHMVPDLSSWTGRTLFRFDGADDGGLYCTFEFIELARKEKFSGVTFFPILPPADRGDTVFEEIDPIKSKVWPPELIEKFL